MKIVFLESAEFTYATLLICNVMSRFSAFAAADREAPITRLASEALPVCLYVCLWRKCMLQLFTSWDADRRSSEQQRANIFA
jgi:hypothetical protein